MTLDPSLAAQADAARRRGGRASTADLDSIAASIRRAIDLEKPEPIIQRPKSQIVASPPMIEPGWCTGLYFIRSGHFIKIGVSSNVCQRLVGLHAMNPHGCVGVGFIREVDNDKLTALERDIHQRFAAHCYRNEWFHAHASIEQFIEERAGQWPSAMVHW